MSGQHHFVVRPEKSEFEKLLSGSDGRIDNLASRLGVSSGTASKLVNGIPVTPRILQQIAERLRISPSKLIEEDKNTFIPAEVSTLKRLRWGWFIDNDRIQGGSPSWFWEKIDWDSESLAGRITNQSATEYAFTCTRISDRLLALAAVQVDGPFAFAANFTHYFPQLKVLTGVWCGLNDLRIPSVFRMFVSAEKLTLNDLLEISELAKIDTLFSANNLQVPGIAKDADAQVKLKKPRKESV